MKSFLLLLVLTITKGYGQIEVELYFKDDCDNSIRRLEYQMFNLDKPGSHFESSNSKVRVPSKGSYLISSSYSNGNKVSTFDLKLEITDFQFLVDTLSIPRIKFTTKDDMQSTEWNYFNCGHLCNGDEIDFYPNGQKRMEGDFREGKPVRLVEYRENGTKERVIWYKIGYLEYERIEYFDKTGKLTAYATFRKESNEIIKRVYDSKGTLQNREVLNQNN